LIPDVRNHDNLWRISINLDEQDCYHPHNYNEKKRIIEKEKKERWRRRIFSAEFSLCPQPVENFFIYFATAKFYEYNVMSSFFSSYKNKGYSLYL
jgi:hypothetical protein